ncbi:MAG: urea ABC transporter ATP-binding subunit UrtE [Polyangia bacterium]|jgi:urea transport system ATP-binding protein
MLAISEINQFYGESHTLWDAHLEVPAGGCTCLMGRNGVGKTTLLKVIMGLLPARGGHINFDGRELSGRGADMRARAGIGYVPQGREIFPQLTVEENLRIGLAARRRRESSRLEHSKQDVFDRAFDLFPVLRKMLHRRGGDLSGGQQQQLAIARALVVDPQLLILDEPTEGIQPNVVHDIGDVIMRLNHESGIAVLLVEQKLPFARRVARSFCIMDRGRTVADGAMTDLSDDLVRQHLTV